MKIAVDAMGGDFAPGIAVEGAAQALADFPDYELVLKKLFVLQFDKNFGGLIVMFFERFTTQCPIFCLRFFQFFLSQYDVSVRLCTMENFFTSLNVSQAGT